MRGAVVPSGATSTLLARMQRALRGGAVGCYEHSAGLGASSTAEVLSSATNTVLARMLRAARRCCWVLRAHRWQGCCERRGGAVGCYEHTAGKDVASVAAVLSGATSTPL